jgi:hypothetical protein
MGAKPIKIVKVAGGYNVFVRNVPVVMSDDGKSSDLNRPEAGLKVPKGYKPPRSTEALVIPHDHEAASLAHTICRYLLSLGDMTFAHTELFGIGGNHASWWKNL